SVQAPGVAVQVGPQGLQGLQGLAGKDGQPGKDADPTILNQLIAATKANTKAIADLTGQVQQIKNQPPMPTVQPPLLRMTALNAAGGAPGTKSYETVTHPPARALHL